MKKLFLITFIILTVGILSISGMMGYMMSIQTSAYEDISFTEEQAAALKEYNDNALQEFQELPPLTKKQWKNKVNNAVGFSFYIETNKSSKLGGGIIGYANWYLVVAIDKNLTDVEYGAVLLHELVHIVDWETNETKTVFKTFKRAYESSDPYLNYIAHYTIKNSLNRSTMDEYKATGRIIKYLEDKGVLGVAAE